MNPVPISLSDCPERVEGPFFTSSALLKQGQGFDKLSPNGVVL
jgi:hypothetical protein